MKKNKSIFVLTKVIELMSTGQVGTGSSFPVSYLLDKYLLRTRTHIRRVFVMRVPTFFFYIHGYPWIPTNIYKNI